MKVKIIKIRTNAVDPETALNDFIKDKRIIDVKPVNLGSPHADNDSRILFYTVMYEDIDKTTNIIPKNDTNSNSANSVVITTTYKDLKNTINDIEEKDLCALVDEIEIKNSYFGDDNIIASKVIYVLKDIGITAIEGTYLTYNKETNSYEPSDCITLIYNTTDVESIDFNNFTYFETSTLITAIHNYLHRNSN